MYNTSATGGYLKPINNITIDGVELRNAIGDILVGVSGLSNDLVRPAYQNNTPPRVSIDTNWIAFFIQERRGDANSYQEEDNSGEKLLLTRHEELDILLSFYGPDCMSYASLIREGLELQQNSEAMNALGMAFVRVGEMSYIPELINERYYERVDCLLTLSYLYFLYIDNVERLLLWDQEQKGK